MKIISGIHLGRVLLFDVVYRTMKNSDGAQERLVPQLKMVRKYSAMCLILIRHIFFFDN